MFVDAGLALVLSTVVAGAGVSAQTIAGKAEY